MTTVAVIPARRASTRFPAKPLADLGGRPLVAHVLDRAREAKRVDEAVVATDDAEIAEAVRACGARAVMTSPGCPSGTDRIAEALEALPDAEIIVNVQGDEPMMPPETIDRAVEALERDPGAAVATAMIRIAEEADFLSPHVVKVLRGLDGRALAFSRAPVPHQGRADAHDFLAAEQLARTLPGADKNPWRGWAFKHFGLYVYRREAVLRFAALDPSPLERLEKLEQLRFLENGMPVAVVEVRRDSVGVDTPEDLEKVRRLLGL